MSVGHRTEAALEGVPFRVVDKNKRSRFQLCDLTKLMLIVTRRKSFAAPHGKGDEEWQAVADELNAVDTTSFSLRACRDKVAALIKKHKQESAASRRASGVAEEHMMLSDLIEAYWQLKYQFEEKKQAASDEAKRKQKRLATAGGSAMSKAALRLKRRKIAAVMEGVRRTPPTSDEDEEKNDQYCRRATPRDREDYREMVGSDYSNGVEGFALEAEEHKHEEDDERICVDKDIEEEEEPPITRKRLRVSEIWVKEEERMERERCAQAARDRDLTRVVEGLSNQTKMLVDFLVSSNTPRTNRQ
ncbi:hypothetical protein L914_13848 [Phytophthora nicotianae]|uniref:Uncharacterized protein n=2 Tax=Phytophthora nicotianae TaxID=4792 RepID=V9ENK7_PHYNI|nr:hypothetical protein F443_14388 [Phytophthora nicotianae P1569]ETM40100.1 hypothetical protein L914_13848 [Phytophthora nicotianae]